MADKNDLYLRELYMLIGKVNKDISYLYYLLIKDGSYFEKEEKPKEEVKTVNTVDSFANWFESI